MSDKYIMAIDEGTTSTRAIIFDKKEIKLLKDKKNFVNISLNQVG